MSIPLTNLSQWLHDTLPLKFIFDEKQIEFLFFFMIKQGPAFTWILNHRLHHKHSDTDGDPHNANRGLFFAHVGWLFTTSHPEVVAKRKEIYMSDVENDQLLMWQTRYDQNNTVPATNYYFYITCKEYALPVLEWQVTMSRRSTWLSFLGVYYENQPFKRFWQICLLKYLNFLKKSCVLLFLPPIGVPRLLA